MYHKETLKSRAYYDTYEEVPFTVKVYFPDDENKEPKDMNPDELIEMADREGYYTIMHSSNMGVCDHWTSERLLKWVKEKFRLIRYVDQKGNTVGYNRPAFSVRLTRDAHYWKSEVWNS